MDGLSVYGISKKQNKKLDVDYILKHLEILSELKEEPELLFKAKSILGV